MKKLKTFILGLLLIALMAVSGCSSASKSPIDTLWKTAEEDSEGLHKYLIKNPECRTDEQYQQDAKAILDNPESSLEQQLKAVIYLCDSEYQEYMLGSGGSVKPEDEADYYLAEYPQSAAYASAYLGRAEADPKAFWDATHHYSHKYYLSLLFAAADPLPKDAIAALITEKKGSSGMIDSDLSNALNKCLDNNARYFIEMGDMLFETDYFEAEYHSNLEPLTRYQIKGLNDVDEAFQYLSFYQEKAIPFLTKFQRQSSRAGTEVPGLRTLYHSSMMLIPDSVPELGSVNDEMPELPLDLEQKKVYVLYESPVDDKYVDGPAQYRIPADFLMSLTAEQVPSSTEDADYILYLKADYVEGNQYYSSDDEPLDIKKLYSYTSVYLYDAKTLDCLGRIGTIKESPSNRIVYNSDDIKPYSYPNMASVEEIYQLYSNVNTMTPDMLNVQVVREREFAVGEEVQIDNWKFVLSSFEVADSIQDGSMSYTSRTSGNKLVKVNLTFENIGYQKDQILPMLNDKEEYLNLYLVDKDFNVYSAADLFSSSVSLKHRVVEPGEAISGSVIFDLSPVAAESGLSFYVVQEPQRAICPLN